VTADVAIANLTRRGLFHLAERVVADTGVPMDVLLGRDRHKSVTTARRALYLALRMHGLSLPEIGILLGRDHTTILAGLRPVGCKKASVTPSTLPAALAATAVA
jgi:chromosomal replication initiation ATPase DnaA